MEKQLVELINRILKNGANTLTLDEMVEQVIKESTWRPDVEHVKIYIKIIEKLYSDIRKCLSTYCHASQCYSLIEVEEGESSMSTLSLTSKQAAIDIFSLQTGLDCNNSHPRRILGIMCLPMAVQPELTMMVNQINLLKLTLRSQLNRTQKSYHERAALLRSVVPALLVQSLYRKVNLADVNTYRVNYAWSDKSKSVESISYKEALAMLEEHAEEIANNQSEHGMSKEDVLENDKKKLVQYGVKDRYVIMKPIKLFPQQTYTYLNEQGERCRRVLKATTPLLCFYHNAIDEITHRHPRPPKFVEEEHSSKYVPLIPQRNLYYSKGQ